MDALSRWVLSFILNSTWQVALVVGAAALADVALRRARARYRHTLWAVSLAAAVVLPAVSTRTFEAPSASATGTAEIPVRSTVPAPVLADSGIVVRAGARRTRLSSVRRVLLAGAHRSVGISQPMMRALLILYWALLVFAVIRFARAWLRARSVRRLACARPLPAHVVSTLERCRRAMRRGIWSRPAPKPSVLWSDEIPGPVTVGALRGAVILPTRLLEGDVREDLEAALAHEMAHVCRRDYLWNLICELALVPVAFHPLTQLVKRRVAEARELACDELAACTLDPSHYARSLVRMASEISRRTSVAFKLDYTLGVFDANILEERVMALLKPRASGRLAKGSLLLGTLVLASSCLLGSRFSLAVAPVRAAASVPQSQPANGADLAAFAGGWQAQFENQPFVKLSLEIQDGRLTGVIRTGDINLDNDGNVTEVTHGLRSPASILDATVEGGSLFFKQQDGSDTLSYKMKVAGADEAKLQMLSTEPLKVQPFTLHRDSAASAGGSDDQIAEYHGPLYAVTAGVSGGVSGGPNGGVTGGSAVGVKGGVSGGVSGSSTGSAYSPKASAPSEGEATGQADANRSTGSLSGIVVDSSGARVPKATVWLVNRDSGARQDAETDETGGFAFKDLAPGRYTLNVMSAGMGGSFRMFTLKADGQPPFFPFVLQPGTIAESAVVTAKLPPGVSVKAGTAAGPRRIRIGGMVEGSKLIESSPQPAYPESAREHGIQGMVLLEATISADGVPTDLKVLSSPSEDLSKAAMDAVQQWKYRSTLLNGEPIAVLTTIAVDFRLEE
jgi:TonB family protein